MSNTATTWARQQTAGSSAAKCILLVLADMVRDVPHVSATGKTWPPMHAYLSIASLCQVTEQDRKTVMSNLQRLEAKGLIARAGTDGQTNQVCVYRLAVNDPIEVADTGTESGTGTSAEIGTGTKSGTVPKLAANSTVFPVEQYRFSASPVPKTGHEPILNHIEPNEPKKKPHGLFDVFLFIDQAPLAVLVFIAGGIGFVTLLARANRGSIHRGRNLAPRVECPQCKASCVAGKRFCSHCGGALARDLERRCGGCKTRLEVLSEYCASCGVRIDVSGE